MRPTLHSAPSSWAATAGSHVPSSPLQGESQADVAIVGGGYLGLSTALHLAEAGARVTLLEAGVIGWGASGRNGGQVNPGLNLDPAQLHRHLGEEAAERAINFAGNAPDVLFDLVRRYSLNCDAIRPGWLQPAHRAAAMGPLQERCAGWQSRGVAMRMLDSAETMAQIGTDRYVGALYDPRGGSLHPLRYARELARVTSAAGARLHENSAVETISREGDAWRLTTSTGSVSAPQVLIATNGYTDALVPRLRQSIVAANSFQIATEPLPKDIASQILPHRHAVSDTRRLVLYFRKDADDRLIIGGRGRFADPTAASDFSHLHRALKSLFPAISALPVAFRWAGRVAMTVDRLPHVHEPQPGLSVAIGFNGRGVALATALGHITAQRLSGADTPWPLSPRPIRPIPFHSLRRAYVGAATAWYMLRDEL